MLCYETGFQVRNQLSNQLRYGPVLFMLKQRSSSCLSPMASGRSAWPRCGKGGSENETFPAMLFNYLHKCLILKTTDTRQTETQGFEPDKTRRKRTPLPRAPASSQPRVGSASRSSAGRAPASPQHSHAVGLRLSCARGSIVCAAHMCR